MKISRTSWICIETTLRWAHELIKDILLYTNLPREFKKRVEELNSEVLVLNTYAFAHTLSLKEYEAFYQEKKPEEITFS